MPPPVPARQQSLYHFKSIWQPILDSVAEDCARIHDLRAGVNPLFWASKYLSGGASDVFKSLGKTQLSARSLASFRRRFPFETGLSDAELMGVILRLLTRLLQPDRLSSGTAGLRGWLTVIQDIYGRLCPIAVLCNTEFARLGAVSLPHLMYLFDTYITFTTEYCKVPDICLGNVVWRSYGHGKTKVPSWDLGAFGVLVRAANLNARHFGAYLQLLRAKQLERTDSNYAAGITPYDLTKMLNHVTQAEIQDLPRWEDEASFQRTRLLGIPAYVALPEQFRFGLDFSKVRVNGVRPVAITTGGQVIYRDAKGQTLSEGNPLPLLPAVEAWGAPMLQILVTRDNFGELAPFFADPPKRCPWEWYKRWGNKAYREDGQPVHPGPLYKGSVEWLEETGVTVESLRKGPA